MSARARVAMAIAVLGSSASAPAAPATSPPSPSDAELAKMAADAERQAAAEHGDDHAAPDRQFGLLLTGLRLTDAAPGSAPALGVGAEWLMLGQDQPGDWGMEPRPSPWLAEVGGFATLGRGDGYAIHRDVIDVHGRVGAAWRRWAWLQPYATGGLDALYITTHSARAVERGTTLGVSFTAGLMGSLSRHLLYSASIGYVDAIVPGTGEALGGTFVQVGLGLQVGEDRY